MFDPEGSVSGECRYFLMHSSGTIWLNNLNKSSTNCMAWLWSPSSTFTFKLAFLLLKHRIHLPTCDLLFVIHDVWILQPELHCVLSRSLSRLSFLVLYLLWIKNQKSKNQRVVMRFFWMSSFSYCSLGHSKFLCLPEVNVYFWMLSMLQSWESMMGQETQLVSLTQPDFCFSNYLSCTYISYSWLFKVCNDLPSLQQIPLTLIPSRFCYEEGCTKEDPLSQENIRKLAEPLPFAKHIHSKLVCYISKELMNEDNPPLVLPNGYVYSTRVRVSFMNMVKIFYGFLSVCMSERTLSHCQGFWNCLTQGMQVLFGCLSQLDNLLDWCLVWWGSMDKHHKDTCLKMIGLWL